MRGKTQARGSGWNGSSGWGGPRQEPETLSVGEASAWFAGRLPDGWFTEAPEVTVDREEILVVGTLPDLTEEFTDAAERAAASSGRISRFREQTRDERIEIARQAEHRFGRKVAWGARVGEETELFTVLSVPVMTRLRQPERMVLDTLVASGVARSRSDALAWAVRLVGRHAEGWLEELREAMTHVDELRRQGPDLD
ncbi:hypothetical protein [Actinospica durhamensis]|uniref:hypothetical protein n=1 Tax=Actinospica durhamensis TaxID=1508375 RepID=UPI002484CEAA|nr:hypothetical protein [Actinospica durhamensis]